MPTGNKSVCHKLREHQVWLTRNKKFYDPAIILGLFFSLWVVQSEDSQRNGDSKILEKCTPSAKDIL